MPAIRSDIKIGNLEKKLGLMPGTIRNPDGTDARSDKRLGTLRQEYVRRYAGPPVRVSAEMKAAAEAIKKAAAAKKAKAAGLPTATVRPATAAPKPKAAAAKPKVAAKATVAAKPKMAAAKPKATTAKARKK